ncbi:Serine/threonine-protein kinase [Actinidia chinensis var. chinensis]|uniref:Serine/threonine-protein kinase n=1 Tax=Actinidia chinensis var. chinensis TaxID=1590841 RepID=A0A2R6QWS9_ACTCC|nr:Serine/threonine-protein kinase [Actinidia chinensis var. chinensis]
MSTEILSSARLSANVRYLLSNRLTFVLQTLFLDDLRFRKLTSLCPIPTGRKPSCNDPGAACLDPRLIGANGTVFYFHGKSNEHFSLVSDLNLQINARFIGLRPEGRPQDYTWIQALGILFDSHSFSVDATKASTWDDDVDHMKFSYNGKELVEGVLGQTYQPDFKNPAKLGVAMPVVGGENKYRTTSLLSADCGSCMFSSVGVLDKDDSLVMDFGTLDCTGEASSGNGIVCRK